MAIIELQENVREQLSQEVIIGLDTDEDVQQLERSVDKQWVIQNEQLIMSFLMMLVAALPGVVGKMLGQSLIVAAKAWFSANQGHSGRTMEV